jgi:hypothetical protein
VAAVLLALAGAGVAVAFATGAFKTSTNTVVEKVRRAGTGTTTSSGPAVSAGDVRDVLRQYATDWSNEDGGALGALFTPDLVRRDTAKTTTGRDTALAIYRDQWTQLSSPTYTLTNVAIVPGQREATAHGDYEITAAGKTPATGTIGFHLTSASGTLLIDEIDLGK